MKKYRALEIVCEFLDQGQDIQEDELLVYFTIVGIGCLIKDGFIEEIKQPEFTERDMIDFAKSYAPPYKNVESDLISWKKS